MLCSPSTAAAPQAPNHVTGFRSSTVYQVIEKNSLKPGSTNETINCHILSYRCGFLYPYITQTWRIRMGSSKISCHAT
ncbi:unnamed protein product [Thelazia callipaeda]|uniref:Secreted protein n=1 Tax=Thelazia callipaeda TaxID=103827 RepID=A0A0N5CTA6_THECL|nr:unnamed protein product [Thelazia callipaeda]